MQCEVVKDCWTIDELRRELLIWTGTEIGRSQLYQWLSRALITNRGIYTDRDRVKLLKFGEYMRDCKRLEIAENLLLYDMEKNPNNYPHHQTTIRR